MSMASGTARPVARTVVDDATLTEVVEAHWTALLRLAVLLVGDEASAQDVVQECCERVWRVKPPVGDREHLIAYLRTSVVNRSRSVHRRRRTAERYLPFLRMQHVSAADRELVVREDQRELLAALARLPNRQREVLILRYWADLSESQIAATLGIAQGTVKSTAHRALSVLQERLEATR